MLQQSSNPYIELRLWAEMYVDAQKPRIASSNRLSRASNGLDPTIYENYLTQIKSAEEFCGKEMVRCYKRVVDPNIIEWQTQAKGIGAHMLALLLGRIGHPVHTIPRFWVYDTPDSTLADGPTGRYLTEGQPFDRSISQLWQYCGHGDARMKKRKGMSQPEAMALGNPQAKTQVYLMAVSTIKQKGAYRALYDEMRLTYQDKTHTMECPRCGPSGKPAQPGSLWSPGHQHNGAIRIVGKTILKDLWLVASGKEPTTKEDF